MTEPHAEALQQLDGQLHAWLPQLNELQHLGEHWLEAWNAHDLEAILALCTDDVVIEDPAMFGGIARGQAEFREFTETFFAAFPDARFEPVGAPALGLDGTTLAQRWRATGTFSGSGLVGWPAGSKIPSFAPTGRSFEVEGVDLYEIRHGRVSRMRLFYDLFDWSQQIGLIPGAQSFATRLLAPGQRVAALLMRRSRR